MNGSTPPEGKCGNHSAEGVVIERRRVVVRPHEPSSFTTPTFSTPPEPYVYESDYPKVFVHAIAGSGQRQEGPFGARLRRNCAFAEPGRETPHLHTARTKREFVVPLAAFVRLFRMAIRVQPGQKTADVPSCVVTVQWLNPCVFGVGRHVTEIEQGLFLQLLSLGCSPNGSFHITGLFTP